LESGRKGDEEEEEEGEGGENKAPQSQRDSLSISGFNLLIRSSRTHHALHLNNTPPPSSSISLSPLSFFPPSFLILHLTAELQECGGGGGGRDRR